MRMLCLRLTVVALLLSLLATPRTAGADVRLASIFSDHMVLQRDRPIRIWGWADPRQSVTVTLGDATATATADESGRWQAELPARAASAQPVSLTVRAGNAITLEDILIGEVWLCSGQSNMEWTVALSTNAPQEIAAADHPLIRHIKVPHAPATTPQETFEGQWQICSPATAGAFTACGYFMARDLLEELQVPIGLINSSWGGTRIEPWTPPAGFAQVPALEDILTSVIGRTPGTAPYQERLAQYIASTESWVKSARAALEDATPLQPSPPYPDELKPFTSHQEPTMLYNGMIHPFIGFPLRGAIWYQGESNHGEGMLYAEKKKALIGGWRQLWGQGDFPFYFVQIAPFRYGNEDPSVLATFWEAQATVVEEVPHTGMVVINDIATLDDIHPPNKQDVGHRLALLALKHDYGRDVVAHSPTLKSLAAASGRLTLTFENTGGGLKTRDGKAPTHFEIIGPGSRGYQPAQAKIEGDAVILTADGVSEPTAFRFAWHKLAEPNLTGGTGLPVGAVRGGDVPDMLSLLNIEADYTLVYDLNLARLGSSITYDADHSGSVGAFDRVGYLLELKSAETGEQTVFVSMDAFTDKAGLLGIPTASSTAQFQQPVNNLEVFSNVEGLSTADGARGGNIEFWPHNYGPSNGGNVTGASSSIYDFGDHPGPPVEGYGSMQVHDPAAGQTVFAINHWGAGNRADIGIGNSAGNTRDWTFAGNAGTYQTKRLRVYVRETGK